MEVYSTKNAKISKDEAHRVASVYLAIQLHNFRSDMTRDTDGVVDDAKRILKFIEDGT